MKRKSRVLIIVNPKSERLKAAKFESLLANLSKKYLLEFDIYYTTGVNDLQKTGEKINAVKPSLVIVAGGDGTINMVAYHLINTPISLGIIPAGSANGLARNLGISWNIHDSLKHILDSSPKTIDVIRINDSLNCLHLSDVGINARIVKRFEKEGSRGILGYGKQMLKELFSKRTAFLLSIRTSSINKKYKAEMLVIANAEKFGTGAIINPGAKTNDGYFELVIIKPYPWWAVFQLGVTFFTGSLNKMKYVKLIRTSSATIDLFEKHNLQVDGEIIENIEQLEVKIMPDALKIRY